jgi:imidazolonepropionase-like amidohydrolase
VDREELRLLGAAGLDGAAILDAATRVPAERWGWGDLGVLAEGRAASFLVVARDPLQDPLGLAEPVEVWIDGVRR